jgi:anti-sigma-K factor RskA
MNESESDMSSVNNRHTCDEILPLIPAYAIGATDPDETALVESNLATCPEARAELADYRRMADDLRAGVPQIEPPADLKARLIAATSAPSGRPAPVVIPAAAQPQRRMHPAWAAFAAAALLLVVSNVFWLVRTNNAPAAPEGISFTQEIDWSWLQNETNTSTWALVLYNPESQTAVLCAYNFPPLPEGEVYQLWLRNDEGRISGGTFDVNERGFGLLQVKTTGPMRSYETAGITNEPDGGSTEPTGESVARGEI